MAAADETVMVQPPSARSNELHNHNAASTKAIKYTIPQTRVINVEHPCFVKNIDQGLKSLGGERNIQHLFTKDNNEARLTVSLRPDDPFATKLVSSNVSVDNALFRLDVPRRTGRKRKRGTNGPFLSDSSSQQIFEEGQQSAPMKARTLLRTLRDNQDRYTIEPVGFIKEAHRFHGLPDFQFMSSDNPTMKKVARHLVNPTISDFKGFKIDNTVGAKPGAPIIGPPQATTLAQQLHYLYQQNPAVETVTNAEGQTTVVNTQAARKRDVYALPTHTEKVPQAPPSTLPPLSKASPRLKETVSQLQTLLKDRPIVTRRVAMNSIDCATESLFKEATQYAGYSFRSGPWRDALVTYGIDPRTDPKYAIYQTIVVKLALLPGGGAGSAPGTFAGGLSSAPATGGQSGNTNTNPASSTTRDSTSAPNKNRWLRAERYTKDLSGEKPSHIFDGRGISTNGKTWQILDVTDPVLRNMFTSAPLRTTCDVENWGWYCNGTLAIGRTVMRDKAHLMLQGLDPGVYDEVYERICSLPAIMDEETLEEYSYAAGGRADNLLEAKAQELTAGIRTVARQKVRIGAAGEVAKDEEGGSSPDAEMGDGDEDGRSGGEDGDEEEEEEGGSGSER